MMALLQRPIVRQAIQAGLGVTIASEAGLVLSGQRWYWAVIAAFIVSIGVDSRWEAAVKGLQRLLGTLAGIIVGIFLAFAVSGHTNVALALVLLCIFFAFYAFQTAYGIMMFCITLMLALLYGLMGAFQPHLLVLRLEETAAGAAVAVAVSFVVLPARQTTAFRDAARAYLESLARTLRTAHRVSQDERRASVSDLQRTTQALRNAIGPAKRGWLPFVPMTYRRAVRSAMLCAYLAHELVDAGTCTQEQAESLAARIDDIRRGLDRAGAHNGHAPAPERPAETPHDGHYAAMLDAAERLERDVSALAGG